MVNLAYENVTNHLDKKKGIAIFVVTYTKIQ